VVILVIVIVFAGIAAFFGYRYLMLNTKDATVNHQKYLGNHSNSPQIYADPSTGLLYSPFNIAVAQMDNLMLLDIEDDPEYAAIELQTFDDTRGQAARVLLYHHIGSADSYFTDKAFVVKDSLLETSFLAPDMVYHFDVTPSGLDASLRMPDHAGKSIEFRIKETSHKKWSKGFLAPVGGSDGVKFDRFPFYHMKGMNFVRRSGTEIAVKIGGEERKPKKLPVPADWELVYLSRYTANPVMGCWNTPHDGILLPLQPKQQMTYQTEQTRYELVNNAGHFEIRKMVGFNDKHNVSFEFSPPIPDLPGLKDGNELKGRFSAGADGTLGIVAGTYRITRQGNTIDMEIHPQEGWQPMSGPLWVTAWLWKGAITVGVGHAVSMKSAWLRKK
jgi:hypothetical protein